MDAIIENIIKTEMRKRISEAQQAGVPPNDPQLVNDLLDIPEKYGFSAFEFVNRAARTADARSR